MESFSEPARDEGSGNTGAGSSMGSQMIYPSGESGEQKGGGSAWLPRGLLSETRETRVEPVGTGFSPAAEDAPPVLVIIFRASSPSGLRISRWLKKPAASSASRIPAAARPVQPGALRSLAARDVPGRASSRILPQTFAPKSVPREGEWIAFSRIQSCSADSSASRSRQLSQVPRCLSSWTDRSASSSSYTKRERYVSASPQVMFWLSACIILSVSYEAPSSPTLLSRWLQRSRMSFFPLRIR